MTTERVTLAELLKDGLFIDGDWIESKDQDPAGDVRLIQLADVGDGIFRNKSARFLTSAKARELRCTFLNPGDVLVARMPEPLGRACIFPGVGQPAVTAVDVCILRPNPRSVSAAWLTKAINSPNFRESMQQFVRGTTRQRISRKNLGLLNVDVPSLPEQVMLSRIIDKISAKGNSAASHTGVGSRAVRSLRQAILIAACSGQLTMDWRDGRASGRSVDLNAARQRRMGKSGRRFREPVLNPHADIGELPDGWQRSPLGLVLSEIKYGTSQRSEYGQAGVPVLRIPNVSGDRLDVSDLKFATLDSKEAEALRLRLGDLLMIRSNGSVQLVGKTLPVTEEAVDMTYAGYLMRLRVDENAIQPEFLHLVLASLALRRQIEMPARSTSGVNNINTDEVRGLVVPIPPPEEQTEIVDRASKLISTADLLLAHIDTASRAVERTSQAILAKAFRGELISSQEAVSA